MKQMKSTILLTFLGLCCPVAAVFAGTPTSHHAVTVTATIIFAGHKGNSTGQTILNVTNESIIKAAFQEAGDTDLKVSDYDLAEDDESGEIDIVQRSNPTIPYAYFMEPDSQTNETTSFYITGANTLTLYRIENNFFIIPPRPANIGGFVYGRCNIEFTSQLLLNSAFKSSTATFTGGSPVNDDTVPPYRIQGRLRTGSRIYLVYSNF